MIALGKCSFCKKEDDLKKLCWRIKGERVPVSDIKNIFYIHSACFEGVAEKSSYAVCYLETPFKGVKSQSIHTLCLLENGGNELISKLLHNDEGLVCFVCKQSFIPELSSNGPHYCMVRLDVNGKWQGAEHTVDFHASCFEEYTGITEGEMK